MFNYAPSTKSSTKQKAETMTTKKTERPSLADQELFANVLLYGEPKSGKTTAAAAAARLGRVCYIDAEAGLKKGPLSSFGIPITNIEPYSDITIDALDALFWELQEDVPVSLVWDSVSESHKKLLEATARRSRDKALAAGKEREAYTTELGDYGTNTAEMRHLLRQFRDLPCHTVFVALEKRTQDENTGKVKYGPDLTDKLASDLLGYVDVIGHTYTVSVEGEEEPQYWAEFRNKGVYVGGDRFHALPPRLINPSLDRVVKYLQWEMDVDSDPEMQEAMAKAKPEKGRRVAAGASAPDDAESPEEDKGKATEGQPVVATGPKRPPRRVAVPQ
jgi:hypothetical protein